MYYVFGTNPSTWTTLSSKTQLVGRDPFSIKMNVKGKFSSLSTQNLGFFCLALKYVCFGKCGILHNVRFKLQCIHSKHVAV